VELPTLRAVILDFSSVNNVDITSIQNLIDVRNQLDRYAAPDTVEWHFASINNRWTKRALAVSGFGAPTDTGADVEGVPHRTRSIFSVAEIGGGDSAARAQELGELGKIQAAHPGDVEVGKVGNLGGTGVDKKLAAIHGLNLPFFHIDLVSAVHSAVLRTSGRPSAVPSPAGGNGEVSGGNGEVQGV
jgi:solute carrier family 26 (sodium-independent sulfate anion transporter), member 11